MLVYYWVKRLLPVLLLAAMIVLARGHLKPFVAADSADQKANTASSTVKTAASTAAGAGNQSEPADHPGGAATAGNDWVRTRVGWEREAKWFANSISYEPGLHPAVVAALVSLVALWTLVAFPADAAGAANDPDAPDTTFMSDS